MLEVTQYNTRPEGTWSAKKPNISGMIVFIWFIIAAEGSS